MITICENSLLSEMVATIASESTTCISHGCSVFNVIGFCTCSLGYGMFLFVTTELPGSFIGIVLALIEKLPNCACPRI